MNESGGFFRGVVRFFRSATEPRDIVVRRRGSVAYVTLSRPVQVGLMAALIGCGVWFSHITVVYFGFQTILDAKNREIAKISNDNGVLSLRMSAMRNDITDVAGTLKRSHHHLVGLLAQNDDLRAEIDKIREGLRESESKRAAQLRRQAALSQQLAALEGQLQRREQESSELTDTLDKTRSKLNAALIERGEIAAARDGMKQKLKKLEERIALLRDSHEIALKKVTRRTVADIRKIASIIATAGLDVNQLLKTANPEGYGVGGPYVLEKLGEPMVDEGVTALDRHLAHWEDLQKLLSHLPLIAPVDHYRLGSPFGRRRDPMNGKWAEHHGVDLSTRSRSPIYAAGQGKVVFGGWKGQYGRVVEIDHGFGLKTRYAHMRSIAVRRGQRVGLGEKIGQVGTSGRSTGPHVHYEVLINGKPVDPLKFIQAGKDVFKG